ncbi:PH domain [Fragilaria crotonensis]|nr:PH domain [Fragilaria crotonensis]
MRPGTKSRTRRGYSKEDSASQDAAIGGSDHPVTVENAPLSSDDESTVVYETDLQELSRSPGDPSTGFDVEFSTPDSNLSNKTREYISSGLPLREPPSWSGNIAGKICCVVPDPNLQGTSDDESIKYEADLDYHTAEELMDSSVEKDRQLPQRLPSTPPLSQVCPFISESLSSDDYDFEDDDDGFPLLKGSHAQCMARNVVMEHRIFIKCLMALLEQRDLVAVDMDDPNTLKCGPLKKATHLVKGAWKVKYVEIRRGMFSYYDDCLSKDAASEGDLVRKNVRLTASGCTCRAVKLNHKSLTLVPGQAIFELTVEGSPRRFWMANSREERSAWIRAIHDAMVGGNITRDELQMDHAGRVGKVSRRSPYKRDLETYLKVQRDVKNASNKLSYVGALAHIIGHTLNVPVKWISEQHHLNAEEAEKAFREDTVTTGVNQLWKDLARDTVKINGELITGKWACSRANCWGGHSRDFKNGSIFSTQT